MSAGVPKAERTNAHCDRHRKPGRRTLDCRRARPSSASCIIGRYRRCRSHAPGDTHARSPSNPPGSPGGARLSNFEGGLNGHTIEEEVMVTLLTTARGAARLTHLIAWTMSAAVTALNATATRRQTRTCTHKSAFQRSAFK